MTRRLRFRRYQIAVDQSPVTETQPTLFFRLCGPLLFFILTGCSTLQVPYFKVLFVDQETGRGIPLVELETTSSIRYVSDSAGWVAISPSDVEGDPVYFHVRSHGYEAPEDSLGFRGIRVTLSAGEQQIVPLRRINIAERLYRVTGEGIYHDSKLIGKSTVLPDSMRPKGRVFGQDSVVNAIYQDKLFWFWGDTTRADYPLGNFEVSGAVSPLPGDRMSSPDDGIDLTYFTTEDGLTRPMCPIEGDGQVWIRGLVVLDGNDRDTMLGGYVRMENLVTRRELGIAKWNDDKEVFEKYVEFPLDTPLELLGHPIQIVTEGETWFYFGDAFLNIRVRANLQDVIDPQSYQAFTSLRPGSRWNDEDPPLDRDQHGALVWGWKKNTDLITPTRWAILLKNGLVKPEDGKFELVDVETGDRIIPHSGSITWNEHRQRWILITVQIGGRSLLGEVWYAEAADPMGPWSAARRIVTHDHYSFYNVKQHPYFASGNHLYFEGTYTWTFSGNDQATPRYEYNQIMYRLNLDDARLPRMMDTHPARNSN